MDLQTSAVPSEARQLAEYHSLSGYAVVSFLLGLFSPLALVHVVLWFLPLTGIVCACLGLRATLQDGVSGRRLAWFGLLASTFMFCCAATQFLARDAFRLWQARRLAELWIELIQNQRLQEAHHWTLSSEIRVDRWELLDDFYRENLDQEKKCQALLQKPGVRELAMWGTSAGVQYLEGRRIQDELTTQTFEFSYRVTRGAESADLRIQVVRRRYPDIQYVAWRIVLPDPRPPEPAPPALGLPYKPLGV